MITITSITYYHKTLNNKKLEVWEKHTFNKVWAFGGKNANTNSGYENANNVNIRIPMEYVQDKSIFSIGDIVVIGIHGDITKQSDLQGQEFYNVTSINVNDFGNNPHVHLGGR